MVGLFSPGDMGPTLLEVSVTCWSATRGEQEK